LASYSQDAIKIKQIDSLVNLINSSNYKLQRDTIKQDYPDMGLSMRTYLSAETDGSELKKYINDVYMTATQNGTAQKTHATNIFYFNHNKLIKVQEDGTEDKKELHYLWYYADDKPIYYTSEDEGAQERASMLLNIAKAMMQKMGFK
jgi:hypothetical protein